MKMRNRTSKMVGESHQRSAMRRRISSDFTACLQIKSNGGLLLCLVFLTLTAPRVDAFGAYLHHQRSLRDNKVFQRSTTHLLAAKKRQQPKRKPRFGQEVYTDDAATPKSSSRSPSAPRKPETSPARSSSDHNDKPRSISIPRQYQRDPSSSSSSSTPPTMRTRPRNNFHPTSNAPWNSGKSMEELESIMTRRWGTDATRWSDDDDDEDYEIVDDDDEGDDESNGNIGEENYFFRPQTTNGQASTASRQEFYDHDDPGYEPPRRSPTNNNNILHVDQMIAPKPAGGRGTNQKGDDEYASWVDGEDAGSGFFLNKNAPGARANGNSQELSQQQPNKRERQRKTDVAPPLLDANGKPLLLTLEQAQKDFDALVTENEGVSSVDNEKEEDDDEDEGEDVVDATTFFYNPSKSWEELGITSPLLQRNLQRMNCESPLHVQDKACPSILTGNDVLVGTYTGSGKTLAFMAPLIQRLLLQQEQEDEQEKTTNGVRVLIVAPGRELASQIVSVARELLQDTGLTAMLSIGGTTFSRNLKDLRSKKPAIVVGTPGRLAELVVGRPGEKNGSLKVPHLQSLVLDEFDALLEYKPHREPTAAIVSALKRRHRDSLQSILCSATATDMLQSAKLESFLRPGFAQAMADSNDVLVTSTEGGGKNSKNSPRVSRTVIHGVVHVPHRRFALETLRRILHTDPLPQQILVFVENARKVDIVVEKLENMGIVAAPLSGGSKSDKMDRAEVSKAFREGYVGIVVATELAARGLDAPFLTHVINMDLPTDASHYAHRAGRCGRGGRPGVVINFTANPKDRNVPQKFASQLGIIMHATEARAGKLQIVDSEAALASVREDKSSG